MLLSRGITLYVEGKYEDAINYFMELNQENVEIYFYLSKCYCNIGNKRLQLKYLLRCLMIDKTQPEVLCELGTYYLDMRMYETAIDWYEAALEQIKSGVSHKEFYIEEYWGYIPNLLLCVCYDKLHQMQMSSFYNEQAALYRPNSAAVKYNRTYLLNKLRDSDLKEIENQKELIRIERERYDIFPESGISLVTITNKPHYMNILKENYLRMRYNKKELILVINSREASIEEYQECFRDVDQVYIYQLSDEITLGECLNYAILRGHYEYVAKIDDDDYYSEYYLIDQLNCFHEKDIDVVVKSNRFIEFERDHTLYVMNGHGENKYVLGGAGGSIVAKRSVFLEIPFATLNLAEDEEFFQECRRKNKKVYSSHKFNYIYRRHTNMSDHTFHKRDEELKQVSTQVIAEGDFENIISA